MNSVAPPPDFAASVTGARDVLQRGTLYGSTSLALLIAASSLTMPHQQTRRDELGCDSLCFGSMTSARSLLTLLGATVIGRVSDTRALDHLGGARKLCLVLGVVATAANLLLGNRAQSLPQLWMSIPPVALQQNMNVLKALLSEYHDALDSSATERAGSVGSLGMASGLALMVGPLAGSLILQTYNQATIGALAFLLLSAALVGALPTLPAHHSTFTPSKASVATIPTKTSTSSIWNLSSIQSPAAIFLLTSRLLSTLSFHIFQTIWTVSLRERFNFGPKDYGRFFSMIGLFFALSQGVFAKLLLKRFGDAKHGRVRLLTTCFSVMALNRFLAFRTTNIGLVYILFATMVVAVGVIATIFAADTSLIAKPEERGSFFGLVTAVESGSGMVGPLLGGALAYWHPIHAPLAAVQVLDIGTLLMFAIGYERIVLGQLERQKAAAGKKLQ